LTQVQNYTYPTTDTDPNGSSARYHLHVVWSAPTGYTGHLNGYTLRRYLGGSWNADIPISGASTTSYEDSGLTPGGSYTYYILANYDTPWGNSGWSNFISQSTRPIPTTPTGVYATYDYNSFEHSYWWDVYLTNSSPQPGDTYEIWRKDDSGPSYYLDATGIVSIPWGDNWGNHSKNTGVYYKIYTVGYGGYSAWSAPAGPYTH
jgi:hypothetical protein